MSSASSISVTVRVRPFSIREAAQLERPDDAPSFFGDGSLAASRAPKLSGKGVRRVVKAIDDQMLVFDPAEENPLAKYQKTILPQGKRVKDMKFGFDRVFDENCSQQDVYECTTKPLLDSVLDGFNATVFAYGATGCGKTHTISGTPQQPGIIFLTCAELFERIRDLQDDKDINLTLSYLEIYNETIRDLLIPGGSKLGLSLREDTNSSIAIAGLSAHSPKTVEEVMDMIVMGNANRTMSPTEANATSSRSHAVLQINVIQKPRTSGTQEQHMAATLSIIDLAGSERASVTKNRGERLLEGANINRSLLALGNCINALCDPAKRNHVPYRDSKLTRLLKFSLGGNCKTVMIVCVSPSSIHYDETHNTLKYANRAKNIKTKVSRNMINVNRHVSEYVKAIYNLRQEVDQLKKRLDNSTADALEKHRKQSSAKDVSIQEGLRRIRAAFEQSAAARNERIEQYKSLRLTERRISMISAWLDAFDEVFESRQDEDPPQVIFKIRSEADKVLRELEQTKLVLMKQVDGSGWEKVIDSAVQNSIRSLQTMQGHTPFDIAVLENEAQVWRTTGERDVYYALSTTDVPLSSTIHFLSRAHFETAATINAIMNTDITESEALEHARRSLFDIQKGAIGGLGHIVRPDEDLSSDEVYKPAVAPRSPRKRDPSLSPVKMPQPMLGPTLAPPKSPTHTSPRLHKVKSPKKAVKFNGKSPAPKKSVRWHEEVYSPVPMDKRSRMDLSLDTFASVPFPNSGLSAPPIRSYTPSYDLDASTLADETYDESSAAVAPAPAEPSAHGIVAPPIRPGRSRFEAGFLTAKPKEHTETPLTELEAVNLLKSEISAHGHQTGLGKAAVRKAPGAMSRPIHKKRSTSASSTTSPETGTSVWKTGTAKRMGSGSLDRKENTGTGKSVLSPKSEAIAKSKKEEGARRLTVAGVGGLRVTPATLQAAKEKGETDKGAALR